jgi:hypothetical protein
MRGRKARTSTASGQRSAGKTASWWHSSQVTASDLTPSERMLPSVIGGPGGDGITSVNGGQDPRKDGGAKIFGMTFANGLAAPCRRPLGGNQRRVASAVNAVSRRRRGPKARVDRGCNPAILGHHGRRPAVTVRFFPPTLRGNAPPVTGHSWVRRSSSTALSVGVSGWMQPISTSPETTLGFAVVFKRWKRNGERAAAQPQPN